MKLAQVNPAHTGPYKSKAEAKEATDRSLQQLYDLLYLMYAENRRSLLIILQGIDASGKDGTVRHIFAGANPQGIRVCSFKRPSDEELRHDFLWRCHRQTPEAGYATIFNRSYYEEVTTMKVHAERLKDRPIAENLIRDPKLFTKRYRQINDFERMLNENGTTVVKFFLHISKSEQKKRLEDRLKDPTKNWKFSPDDIKERKVWVKYMRAFDEMLANTNSDWAPWHVIPADEKWYRNLRVTEVLVKTLSAQKMKFPKVKAKSILSHLK